MKPQPFSTKTVKVEIIPGEVVYYTYYGVPHHAVCVDVNRSELFRGMWDLQVENVYRDGCVELIDHNLIIPISLERADIRRRSAELVIDFSRVPVGFDCRFRFQSHN